MKRLKKFKEPEKLGQSQSCIFALRVLLLVLGLTFYVQQAYAVAWVTYQNGIRYVSYNDREYGVYYIDGGYKGDITIASEVKTEYGGTYPVTFIDNGAFYEDTLLTSVTIPSSVKLIEEKAFYGCKALTTLNLSGGIVKVKSQAFIGSAWFDNQPDGVVYVDKVAYKYKGTAPVGTKIDLAEGTRSISVMAFYDCAGIVRVTMPDALTEIDEYAFYDCIGLTSVAIPSGVKSINDATFLGCTSLATVSLPDSLDYIGKEAFSGCTSLTSLDVPDGVTGIGEMAFFGCTALKSAKLSDGMTSIEYGTFQECSALEQVVLPRNLTSIFEGAFNGTALKSIIIPPSVTTLGSAFLYCTSLTSAEVSGSVKIITRDAFRGCTALSTVKLCEGITGIERFAFSGCKALADVYMPGSLCEIADYAFQNCFGLKAIHIPDLSAWCNTAFASAWCDGGWEGTVQFSLYVDGVKQEGQLRIPDGVTRVPDAFGHCPDITSLVIPSSVEIIDYGAFAGCKSLEKVELSDSVKYIGQSAFSGCTALKAVNIPRNLSTIESYTFAGCSSLEFIDIPSNVATIGEHAFDGCIALNNLRLSEGLKVMGMDAFCNCTSLTSVTIPASVESMGFFTSRVFTGCTSLDSVLIKGNGGFDFYQVGSLHVARAAEGVTSIGSFAKCVNLRKVIVPSTTTEILTQAFMYCSLLDSFVCYAHTPPANDGMYHDYGNVTTLYVPYGCKSAYMEVDVWSKFKDIVEMPDMRINAKGAEILKGGTAYVTLDMVNAAEVTSLSFDVVLSKSLLLNGVTLTDRKGLNHTANITTLNDSTYHIEVASNYSELFEGCTGDILVLTIAADENTPAKELTVVIKDIELTTPSGEAYYPANVAASLTVPDYTHGDANNDVLLDENSATAPEAAEGVNVLVKRTIKADEWSTICLPFTATGEQVKQAWGEDVQLASFTGWESEEDTNGAIVAINVMFKNADVAEGIAANTPMLIKVSEATTEATFDGVNIEPEEDPLVQVGRKASEHGYFYGTYAKTTVPEENIFLYSNQFWYSKGSTAIKGYRGYFELHDVLDAYYDGSEVKMNMFIDDDVTGIENLYNNPLNDGATYDLQGRRVEKPGKGLYIRGGKIIVNK